MAALVLSCATKQAGARALLAFVVIASLVIPVGSARAGSGSGDSGSDSVEYSDATVAAQGRAASIRSDRNAIKRKLSELETQRQEQWDRWALASLALESARNRATAAGLLLAQATNDVEVGEQAVRDYAQSAFMNPPAENNIALLNIRGAQEVSRAHDLLTVVADEQEKVVQELEVKRQIARKRADQAERLVAASEDLSTEVEAELKALDAIVAEQRSVLADVDSQLAAALAEADALRAIDVEAAEKLKAESLAAAEEIKSGSGSSSSSASGGGSGSGGSTAPKASAPKTSAPKASAPKASAPKASAPKASAPKATTPKSSGSSSGSGSSGSSGGGGSSSVGLVTWYDVVSVNGIWVHKSIAGQLRRMLSAAAASGIYLSGGGYRDPEFQKVLRAAHCGPTYYDIHQKPASQCTPPTAPPGRSMHERGLAVDFNYGGGIMKSRSSAGYQWLAANAASYGFYNLPSEPWHWSTNGN